MLDLTAAVWGDALRAGMVWDERRDAPRIRAAFQTLVRTCDLWPGPKRLIEALPPVRRTRALPARLADPAVVAKAQAEIRALLGVPQRLQGARERPLLGGLSEAARGLLQQLETPEAGHAD